MNKQALQEPIYIVLRGANRPSMGLEASGRKTQSHLSPDFEI